MLSCIGLHESRITDHIGCKNAGEAAGDAFFGHEVLLSENAAPWDFMSAPIRSLLGSISGMGQKPT
jgi:hypothetical protein